jgi:hypothetical protein
MSRIKVNLYLLASAVICNVLKNIRGYKMKFYARNKLTKFFVQTLDMF